MHVMMRSTSDADFIDNRSFDVHRSNANKFEHHEHRAMYTDLTFRNYFLFCNDDLTNSPPAKELHLEMHFRPPIVKHHGEIYGRFTKSETQFLVDQVLRKWLGWDYRQKYSD